MRRNVGRMVATLAVSLMLMPLAVAADGAPAKATRGWVQIFNGKDLTGWTPKFAGHALGENYLDTFRVEDGLLKVSYDRYQKFGGEFGHLFYRDKLSHYRVRVEYRFTGRQAEGGPAWGLMNSGIMLHGQAPESMGKDQRFPVSIEAQMLGDDGTGTRYTGNPCTPGTHVVMGGKLITEHCIRTSKKAVAPDRWTTMEVEVRGGEKIRHLVDGEVVAEYETPQLDPGDSDGAAQKLIRGSDLGISEGYVSLQAESHPLEFRKVELLVLEDE